MMYALRMAKEEAFDHAHTVSSHGPDITALKREARVTTGIAPDRRISPTKINTSFKHGYKDDWETRRIAFQKISIGESERGVSVDLTKGPGIDTNPTYDQYVTFVDHFDRMDLGIGSEGVGAPIRTTFTNPTTGRTFNKNVYSSTMTVPHPIYRTKTTIEWDGTKWRLIQHFPWAQDFDVALGRYSTAANGEVH